LESPIFGLIEPEQFIPLIEYKPLIINVGKWVFETAWQQILNLNDLYVSINISPRQAQDKKHIQGLIDFCEDEKISPQRVILEITESAFMQRHKKTEMLLRNLAKAGFPIAIDDFGTKYSSLGRITNLSLSYLKIDKFFVDGIGKNESDQFIIKSILELADSLGLKVIAEGVETKEQLNFLEKSNCPYIQGFYFSKPLSYQELIKLL
jgi:EAL domain-containing protein (putative c-di-GMP-specific phosphodiesterase class I)